MIQEAVTPDEIITLINVLNDDQKRELSVKTRNTPEGIKAYQAMLYGITKTETGEVKQAGITVSEEKPL